MSSRSIWNEISFDAFFNLIVISAQRPIRSLRERFAQRLYWKLLIFVYCRLCLSAASFLIVMPKLQTERSEQSFSITFYCMYLYIEADIFKFRYEYCTQGSAMVTTTLQFCFFSKFCDLSLALHAFAPSTNWFSVVKLAPCRWSTEKNYHIANRNRWPDLSLQSNFLRSYIENLESFQGS